MVASSDSSIYERTLWHSSMYTYTAMLEVWTWSYLLICNHDKHNYLLKISNSNVLKHDATFSCTILSNDTHFKFAFLIYFFSLICIFNRQVVCTKHSLGPWCLNNVKTLHWIKYEDHRYENVRLEIAGDSLHKIYCYLLHILALLISLEEGDRVEWSSYDNTALV